MAIETQNWLDEMKTPSIKTLQQAKQDIGAYIPNANDLEKQNAVWTDLIGQAEISESEEMLLGKFEDFFSKYRAIVQRQDDQRRATRALISLGKSLKAMDADIRQLITDESLPYTV